MLFHANLIYLDLSFNDLKRHEKFPSIFIAIYEYLHKLIKITNPIKKFTHTL